MLNLFQHLRSKKYFSDSFGSGLFDAKLNLKGSYVCSLQYCRGHTTPMGSHPTSIVCFYKHVIPLGLNDKAKNLNGSNVYSVITREIVASIDYKQAIIKDLPLLYEKPVEFHIGFFSGEKEEALHEKEVGI